MGTSDSKLTKVIDESLPPTERYYGLFNYGNTCYANSVLQALYFCQPFRAAVMKWTTEREARLRLEQEKTPPNSIKQTITNVVASVTSSGIKDSDPPLLTALSFLFDEIGSQKGRTGTIRPSQFISTLKQQNVLFDSYNQQDAHEFLMFLLNDVSESLEKEQKELLKKAHEAKFLSNYGRESFNGGPKQGQLISNNKKDDASAAIRTFVHSIFQGTLTNETKCLTCDTVTSRDEHFLDLPVDIEQNSSVSHCLRRISKVERLSGTNKFSCECCGALQEAEKRTLIKKLPKILVLHLKRFKYFENIGGYAKLSHRVTFPVELRVPSLVPDFGEETRLDDDDLLQVPPPDEEDGTYAPSSQNPTNEHTDPIYYLSGMVLHIGATASSGHYVAFIRSAGSWLQMDDHHVKALENPESLMSNAFGCWNHNPEEPQNSASAYILFYERRN